MFIPASNKRLIAMLMVIMLFIGMAPLSYADWKYDKISLTELMEMFDGRVKKPKESSILEAPEYATVRSKNGNLIYVLSAPKTGEKLFEADEGATVTVYARQSGYALGIVDGTPIGGWMKENNLVPVDNKTGKEPEETETNQQKADSLIAKGLQFERGDGQKQDYLKAEECYKKAIGLGSAEAKARLAVLYIKDAVSYNRHSLYEGTFGDPVFENSRNDDPVKMLLEAAGTEDPVAVLLLGIIMDDWDEFFTLPHTGPEYGLLLNHYFLNIQEDYDELFEEYCARAGLGTALENIKHAYSLGNGDAIPYLNGAYYYILDDSDSDPDESREAQDWLDKRAAENDAYALFLLGEYCKDLHSDNAEAEEYYRLAEAAALEKNDAATMISLAVHKLPESDSAALDEYHDSLALFRKAAEIGDSEDIHHILDILANYFGYWLYNESSSGYYATPTVNKVKYGIVEEFVRIALKKCNADDLAGLGMNLHVESCEVFSAECSLAAAEKGCIGALEELSCMLNDGGYLGDPANWDEIAWINENAPERAFEVIRKAAESGIYPWTCSYDPTIVWMYEVGFGTEKDLKKAEYWREIIEKYWEEKEQED